MSEKGLLSKSIANNISEAIIDKLGGTGYAPTEWSKNINLLGIASADIEEALASITEDASSSDKGLLSLSIASDVGAMLNKKYNTSRGFKPSEVSSAVSALTPLPEKTASSAPFCTFNDGADDVPTKSLVVTISPHTLSGTSLVSETQTGRNLASGGVYEYNARNMIIPPVYLKAGTYTVSFNRGVNVQYIYIRKGDTVSLVGDAYATKSNSTFFTFTADEDAYYYAQLYRTNTSDTWEDYPVTKPQIEIGSTAHAYEPYQTPTQYTASLGRTIYGGQADIVNGTGTDENGNDFTFNGQEIPTRLGYNAFWSDEGDTEVTYRADLDLYEAPSMLLGTNNTETEGNEEQEGNE